MRSSAAMMTLCLFASTRAYAQDPIEPSVGDPSVAPAPSDDLPPDEDIVFAPSAPAPLAVSSTPFAPTATWLPVGPRPSARMSDVAIHPRRPDTLAVASLTGRVWVSVNRGGSWAQVMDPITGLGAASQDEELMLQVEVRIQEILEEQEIEEVDEDADPEDSEYEDPDDAEDAVQDSIEDAIRQATEEAQADFVDPWAVEARRVLDGAMDAARPRVWYADDGTLMAGRADGLWVSPDNGANWTQALDVPVTALTHLPGRDLYVAGTGDGIRFAVDPEIWLDPEDGTEGLFVYDLSSVAEGVWAATSDGVWFAPDAQTWARTGLAGQTLVAVLGDPGWEGGVWVSDMDGVQRSDDGGTTFRATYGQPLRSAVRLVRTGSHLLAASSDGAWESIDGGVSWQSMSRGLSSPDVRAVAAAGGDVYLAGGEGVFRMSLKQNLADNPALGAVSEWVPVETLLDAALSQPGIAGVEDKRARTRWLGSVLPRLRVISQYRPGTQLMWSDSAGTTSGANGDLSVTVRLDWTPAGRKVGSGTVWVTAGEDDVFVDDGSDPALAMSRARRQGVDQRMDIARTVSELYFARLSLVEQRKAFATESVRERVEIELRLSELEAWLDVMTNGVAREAAAALEAK